MVRVDVILDHIGAST